MAGADTVSSNAHLRPHVVRASALGHGRGIAQDVHAVARPAEQHIGAVLGLQEADLARAAGIEIARPLGGCLQSRQEVLTLILQ